MRDVVEDRRRCRTSDLGQDAKDNQPDATADARPAGCAPRERNDTIVLHTQQAAPPQPLHHYNRRFAGTSRHTNARLIRDASPPGRRSWMVKPGRWRPRRSSCLQRPMLILSSSGGSGTENRMCSLARHPSDNSLKGGQGARECWGATPCRACMHAQGPHHRQGCRPECAGRVECR